MSKQLEPMVELFIFEANQMMENMEEVTIQAESRETPFTEEELQDLFRMAHTVKGSSGMMMVESIATLTHHLEDIFSCLQKLKEPLDSYDEIFDIVLACIDFIKEELSKIEAGQEADGEYQDLLEKIQHIAFTIQKEGEPKEGQRCPKKSEEEPKEETQEHFYISKADSIEEIHYYQGKIHFEQSTEMVNIRGFTLVKELEEHTLEIMHRPENLIDEKSGDKIHDFGLEVYLKFKGEPKEILQIMENALYVQEVIMENLETETRYLEKLQQGKPAIEDQKVIKPQGKEPEELKSSENTTMDGDLHTGKMKSGQMLSVHTEKLDQLMDLVGELVVSETMISENPDLAGLTLGNFKKATRRHKKIINELQDISMALRMIPLNGTFSKMKRIIRDMSKELDKNINFVLEGEDTEVDKNVVDLIGDPLMHMIRNAADHGIEERKERQETGKPETGTIILRAKNVGNEVWIQVKDDGKGLDREGIGQKAIEKGILEGPLEDIPDQDIYSCIFSPSFSTKQEVSTFSGRGVGMDVVNKNIEKVGGRVHIDSTLGMGTTFTLKIPLTLAIIPGMIIRTGENFYTIPITDIGECFRPMEEQVIQDEEGNEAILLRNKTYPIIKIYEKFGVSTEIKNIRQGIVIIIEHEKIPYCLFADALVGEQDAVLKPLPKYINEIQGIAGCSMMGSGDISLIIDTDMVMTD